MSMSKVAYNYGHYIFSVKYCKNIEEQKKKRKSKITCSPTFQKLLLTFYTYAHMYTYSPYLHSTYHYLKENVHKTTSLSLLSRPKYVYFQNLSFLVDNNILRITRRREPEPE